MTDLLNILTSTGAVDLEELQAQLPDESADTIQHRLNALLDLGAITTIIEEDGTVLYMNESE